MDTFLKIFQWLYTVCRYHVSKSIIIVSFRKTALKFEKKFFFFFEIVGIVFIKNYKDTTEALGGEWRQIIAV